jgi:hypothetical protein
MRINLVTPFAEKDAVKALGARWDAAKNAGTSSMSRISHRLPGGFRTWRRRWMCLVQARQYPSQSYRGQYRQRYQFHRRVAWPTAAAMCCLGMTACIRQRPKHPTKKTVLLLSELYAPKQALAVIVLLPAVQKPHQPELLTFPKRGKPDLWFSDKQVGIHRPTIGARKTDVGRADRCFGAGIITAESRRPVRNGSGKGLPMRPASNASQHSKSPRKPLGI